MTQDPHYSDQLSHCIPTPWIEPGLMGFQTSMLPTQLGIEILNPPTWTGCKKVNFY